MIEHDCADDLYPDEPVRCDDCGQIHDKSDTVVWHHRNIYLSVCRWCFHDKGCGHYESAYDATEAWIERYCTLPRHDQ